MMRENCLVQTTEWSACSKTCGLGISTRVTNDNRECRLEKQTRLCMVRPCESQLEQSIRVSFCHTAFLSSATTQTIQTALILLAEECLLKLFSPFFSFCRKEKSASAHPDSPSPWNLRSPAAPPPSPTGQSSVASAWMAAAAPPTGPPPYPWSSNAPMDRSWRSTWCSSSPAPATTTALGRMTSSSPCITRRWWETWHEPLKDDQCLWLENKQNSISFCSSVYMFCYVLFFHFCHCKSSPDTYLSVCVFCMARAAT